ncbi:hypothetical protein ABT294_25365 [Nonomuraea sp. NPDC000554]|uniref:hypothetical protein n=1 Tax=Nonomuraea sp. NPDC000554 TaxID=3154259 RepID=UPI00331C7294
MSSLLEELVRRESAARRRVEQLREQIAESSQRLETEEDRLSRLVISRETVEEILDEVVQAVERPCCHEQGRELLRQLLQVHLDLRALREQQSVL